MLYLVQALSAWLTVAVGLGLTIGFFSWQAGGENEKPASLAGFFIYVAPLAVGATVAWLRLLPGRQGLWLETALLLLLAYLMGCGLGCASRGMFGGVRAKAEPAPPAGAQADTAASSAPAGETGLERRTPPALAGEAEALAPEVLADRQAETDAPPPAFAPSPERAEEDDDLRLIRGVNEDVARRLRDLGFRRFAQIAALTPTQRQWIGEEFRSIGPHALRFLIAQARLLAGGVEPEFARALRRDEARRESSEAPLDEAAAEKLLAALPQPIAPLARDEIYAGLRPLALLLPPYGDRDDLRQIRGVDAATAQGLNTLGVWTHRQIARWSHDNALWISSYLAAPGRVEDENWIAQARELAEMGDVSP